MNDIWKAIGEAGKDGLQDFFWKEVQAELNKDCRELFLTGDGRVAKLRIAWDDDKVHFQFSSAAICSDKNLFLWVETMPTRQG